MQVRVPVQDRHERAEQDAARPGRLPLQRHVAAPPHGHQVQGADPPLSGGPPWADPPRAGPRRTGALYSASVVVHSCGAPPGSDPVTVCGVGVQTACARIGPFACIGVRLRRGRVDRWRPAPVPPAPAPGVPDVRLRVPVRGRGGGRHARAAHERVPRPRGAVQLDPAGARTHSTTAQQHNSTTAQTAQHNSLTTQRTSLAEPPRIQPLPVTTATASIDAQRPCHAASRGAREQGLRA